MSSSQWFFTGTAIVLIAMIGALVAVLLLDRNTQTNASTQDSGRSWSVELWSIRHGFRLNLSLKNSIVIGRENLFHFLEEPISLVLDNTVSREHCILYENNGMLWVSNLSSVNPTKLNDQSMAAPIQLMPGDRLALGNCVFLVTRVVEYCA